MYKLFSNNYHSVLTCVYVMYKDQENNVQIKHFIEKSLVKFGEISPECVDLYGDTDVPWYF